MRRASCLLLTLLLITVPLMAGAPSKEREQAFSGTAPPGSYTYPANFSSGQPVPNGTVYLGIEIDGSQLTDPTLLAELIIELSYDGGASWPPLDKLVELPPNTHRCTMKIRGMTPPVALYSTECSVTPVTGGNGRMRARLIIENVAATGTVNLTWRTGL